MKARLIVLQIIFMCYLCCEAVPYCFRYTWVGLKEVTCNKANSTKTKDPKETPCFDPIFVQPEIPDPIYLWKNHSDSVRKELMPDQVCIKYTYFYNGKISNVSYFNGKIIEDKTKAVESGCYSQHVDGHIIEACACRSKDGEMPCNTSVKINCNKVIIAIGLAIPLLIVHSIL